MKNQQFGGSMNRKATLLILAIAFAFSVSYIGIASAKNTTVTGSIEKVNFKVQKITIKDDSGTDSKTFDLTSHTRYSINGKEVSRVNLKEGDKVTLKVNYKNTVESLDIKSS
jgi:Cu/Ag efflux protein CusF